MASMSEYDGICLLSGDKSVALNSTLAEADRLILYHLCGKGHITEGPCAGTPLSGKAALLEVGPARTGVPGWGQSTLDARAGSAIPSVAVTGAPDCLCVYRLATKKPSGLLKAARRAGLYPYNLGEA